MWGGERKGGKSVFFNGNNNGLKFNALTKRALCLDRHNTEIQEELTFINTFHIGLAKK